MTTKRRFSEVFIDAIRCEDGFTADLLNEFEFTGDTRAVHEPLVGAERVEDTQTGTWRWGDCRCLVFRLPDGSFWATDYRASSGDEGEAHYDAGKSGVSCYRVEPVEVTVTKYVAFKDKGIAAEDASS